MSSSLPKGTKFIKAPYPHKYVAILPNGKRVAFGHASYQQYHDSVPKMLGGGLWSYKDHGDAVRRESYRKRHSALKCKNGVRCIDVKYSAAWFSYYFLW